MMKKKQMFTAKRSRGDTLQHSQQRQYNDHFLHRQEERLRKPNQEEEHKQQEQEQLHYLNKLTEEKYRRELYEETILEKAVHFQNVQLVQLENNLLQFYLTHCFVDYDESRQQSEWSKMLKHCKEIERAFQEEECQLRTIVEAEEMILEEELVKGTLAAAKEELETIEEECRALQKELQVEQQRYQETCTTILQAEKLISNTENEIEQTKQRIQILVSKKQDILNNIDRLKEDEHKHEKELEYARQDLERRRIVNKELQAEIERRAMRLTRCKTKSIKTTRNRQKER